MLSGYWAGISSLHTQGKCYCLATATVPLYQNFLLSENIKLGSENKIYMRKDVCRTYQKIYLFVYLTVYLSIIMYAVLQNI